MPRFVLLEHRWNGVHWDFMLEAGDVLRTWAIDAPVVADAGPAGPRACPITGGSIWITRGTSRGTGGRCGGSTRGPTPSVIWEEGRVRVRLEGINSSARWRSARSGPESAGGGSWIFRLGKVD